MSCARPVVTTHVCPCCRERFAAPPVLAATYCPECFGEAFGVTTKQSSHWHTSLLPGIICLCGAFLVALWTVLR